MAVKMTVSPLYIMKNYILIALLLPSCLLAKVSRKEVKYALKHPEQSCLTIDKKHIRFVNKQQSTIRSVKLSSIKRKQKKLYRKIQALRRQQKEASKRHRQRQVSKKIIALAKQLTDQRLEREDQFRRLETKKRKKKGARVSISPTPPEVYRFDQAQPVDTTVKVDEWGDVDDWGRKKPSRFRVYSTNRISIDLDWDSSRII